LAGLLTLTCVASWKGARLLFWLAMDAAIEFCPAN